MSFLLTCFAANKSAGIRVVSGPQGDLYIPETATCDTPKILTIHGGGWRALDRSSFAGVAQMLAERGAIVYNIDYRLTTQAPWPACGDDCLKAATYLSSYETNKYTDCIFTVGASAGGHLSLMTGLRFDVHKVAGVISVSGIADPEPDRARHADRYNSLLAGLTDTQIEAAFPMSLVRADLPDILLTHYFFDEVVPTTSAKNFESRLRDVGASVETYYYDGGRANQGHAIWVPNSEPHRLYGDIEDRIWQFITERFGTTALSCIGRVASVHSSRIGSKSRASIGFEGLDRHLFDPEACYDKLAETGIKFARIQSGWSLCESRRGVYDFTELDAVVSNLIARGIEPWMNLGFGNTNYMGQCYTSAAVGCVPIYYGDACLEAWKRFVATLATRYADKIHYWEVWNEPDWKEFWQPHGANATDYAKFFTLTDEIIRKHAPNAKIGGSCSTILNNWLRAASVQLKDKADFWCLHAYNIIPERARDAQQDPNGNSWDYCGQIAAVKALFARANKPVEIWQGESGFPSWFKANHWLLGTNKEGFGCQEWQAKWLLRRFLADRRAGCASTSFYAAADICRTYSMAMTTQPHPAEHGILDSRHGYARKASHRALSVYNALLAEADFMTSVHLPNDVIVDTYRKNGKDLFAYFKRTDLRDNTPSTNWNGPKFLPKNGHLVDPLSGRIYARPSILPLRDYPLVLMDAHGAIFSRDIK